MVGEMCSRCSRCCRNNNEDDEEVPSSGSCSGESVLFPCWNISFLTQFCKEHQKKSFLFTECLFFFCKSYFAHINLNSMVHFSNIRTF